MYLYLYLIIVPVQVNVLGGQQTISGGGLPAGKYKLHQFHFHVGSTNGQGSEHNLNGTRYPMEVGTSY